MSMLVICLRLARWLSEEEGQDLAEYGLLAVLIAVVAVAAVTLVGTEVAVLWGEIVAGIPWP
jgi:pilus assembly protein Flp/PilA